jgi:hypothetical protein
LPASFSKSSKVVSLTGLGAAGHSLIGSVAPINKALCVITVNNHHLGLRNLGGSWGQLISQPTSLKNASNIIFQGA